MPRLDSGMRRFETALDTGLRAAANAEGAAPLIVAVSGGVDSTALLLGLAKPSLPRLVAWLSGRSVIACYVDHGLRDAVELAEERAALASLCAALGVMLVVRIADVAALRQRERLSWEDAARRCRYAALGAV